ncbi:XRE family transcriptional regulator [Neisseriaceae bacterium B1]
MQEFNTERLQFALDKRGLTKTALADLLEITPRQVNNYFRDKCMPNLNQLALLLKFPVSFFTDYRELPEIKSDAVSFRASSRMSKKLQKQAEKHCETGILLNKWLENEFNLQQANLPDYSDLEPEQAAEQLRLDWGLGNRPIKNLTALLEAKGIRVFSLSMETKDVDAFCTWYEDCPYIFLNTQKSAERSRFDAAHELGHLIRDKFSVQHLACESDNPEEPRDNIEKNANKFASAFLMPESLLRKYQHIQPTIHNLMIIKKELGVSLVALAYRMRQLNMISEWVYVHVLCKQFNKLGYRTNEPEPMVREISSLLEKVLLMLKEDNINIDKIAETLKVSPKDIGDLTFQLVHADLNKHRKLHLVSSNPDKATTRTNPVNQSLRLVK